MYIPRDCLMNLRFWNTMQHLKRFIFTDMKISKTHL